MKVFISWSGKRSQYIAETLHWWLPNVLQAVDPFISSQNIVKGTRGNVVLSQKLEEANVGIICLTPENLTQPWILFEAGALSKLTSAYVCTLLYDLEWSNVAPPLGQFQHTTFDKGEQKRAESEIKALLVAMNGGLQDRALKDDRFGDAFDAWWPRLIQRMKLVPARPKDEKPADDRSEASKLDELLQIVRGMQRSSMPIKRTTGAVFFDSGGLRLQHDRAFSLDKESLRNLLAYIADQKGVPVNSVPSTILTDLAADSFIERRETPVASNEYVLTPKGQVYLDQLSNELTK